MIIAIIAVFIVTTLVAVSISLAVQTNGSTRRDANKKNALEAAEAGLQVALYRLNMLRPQDTFCVGDLAGLPDSTGWCKSATYSLGNGSTYQYWTTPVISTSSCVGLTVVNSLSISQRCVTAVGTSNGVSARSQIRAAAFSAEPLFPYGGIIGVNGITNGNNAVISGGEASNKVISGGNNNTTISGGVSLGPGGSYTGAGSPTITHLANPITLGPVDPGTSNQSSLANCPARQTAGYPACNDDYRITNYLNNPAHPTSPYDPATSLTFTASTRTLTLNNGASLTLGGGLYNFCELDIKNNASISLATGVRTEIFIDSPDDPNSGCPAGSGSFNFKNNVTWSNPLNDPTALQFYVYGYNNGSNVVNFKNNGSCTCILYAPQSTVNLSHNSNNSDLTGAVAGLTVNAPNNFNFTYGATAGTIQARSTGLYYRTAWAQCTPTSPSGTNPGAGCG